MINLVYIYNLNANILQTLGPLPIYLLIFLVIYFIMIRPQVKQQKEHSEMLENIKKAAMWRAYELADINDIYSN